MCEKVPTEPSCVVREETEWDVDDLIFADVPEWLVSER